MTAPVTFSPPHAKLYEKLAYKFGDRAAVQAHEPAAVYLDRMQHAGLLYRVPRSMLKTLQDVQRLWEAEGKGLVTDVIQDADPADVVTVPKPRTLADYRTAVTAGERSGKPVQYA